MPEGVCGNQIQFGYFQQNDAYLDQTIYHTVQELLTFSLIDDERTYLQDGSSETTSESFPLKCMRRLTLQLLFNPITPRPNLNLIKHGSTMYRLQSPMMYRVSAWTKCFRLLFKLILYVPVNIFSVMNGLPRLNQY